MVTPGPGSASRLGAFLLLVRVQALVLLFDVALIEHHDDAHHPGRHRAGGEDDEADDHEEKVVQGAQRLVAQRPQLDAHLAQTTTLQVGGRAAHRLALVCHRVTQKKGVFLPPPIHFVKSQRETFNKHNVIIIKCK